MNLLKQRFRSYLFVNLFPIILPLYYYFLCLNIDFFLFHFEIISQILYYLLIRMMALFHSIMKWVTFNFIFSTNKVSHFFENNFLDFFLLKNYTMARNEIKISNMLISCPFCSLSFNLLLYSCHLIVYWRNLN